MISLMSLEDMFIFRKKEVHILDYARFITRIPDLFLFRRTNNSIIVSVAEQEEMFLHF